MDEKKLSGMISHRKSSASVEAQRRLAGTYDVYAPAGKAEESDPSTSELKTFGRNLPCRVEEKSNSALSDRHSLLVTFWFARGIRIS